MDDLALLTRARRGDPDAWRDLIDRHDAFAVGLARDRLRRAGRGNGEAEDVVQDIWTRLLTRPRIEIHTSFRAFLAAAVLNGTRNVLRRKPTRPLDLAPNILAPGIPEEPLLRTEQTERLEAALQTLPPESRLVLRWAYWDGLAYRTMADRLRLSPDSIGPVLHRARERLKAALEKSGFP